MRNVKLALALAGAMLLSIVSSAFAQKDVTYAKVEPTWFQQGKVSGGISVTVASNATLLPTAGSIAWICNTGSNDAYLAFGSPSVAATTTGSSWLKAGTCGNYDLWPPFSASRLGAYVAALTASSTTTLTVETGIGSGPQQLASSGGALPAGAATAANQTLQITQETATAASTASIDTKTPVVGQAAAATSIPVVLNNDPDLRPSTGAITIQDTGSTTTSGQNSVSIDTGTPTAASTQTQAINGISTTRVQISGTWTGTGTIQGSIDAGVTWYALPARVVGTVFTGASFTANGLFDTDSSGLTNIRVRATAAMTGSMVVRFVSSATSGPTQVINPVRVYDNTSGASATVKAASTAPAATDTAAVVTLRPESYSDPCQTVAKTYTPINISASGSAQIIAGTSAKKTYICHINLVTNAANNVLLSEGTGSNCGSGTAGIIGGTTAASGWNFSANGGISLGHGGFAVLGAATNADNVCLNPSASTQLSGMVAWVQQ